MLETEPAKKRVRKSKSEPPAEEPPTPKRALKKEADVEAKSAKIQKFEETKAETKPKRVRKASKEPTPVEATP